MDVIQPSGPATAHRRIQTNSNVAGATSSKTDDLVDRGIMRMSDARILIAEYKQFYVGHFPFAALDIHETADSLRSESPFLFLCILGVTSHTQPLWQRAAAEEVTRQVSTRLVLAGERCMDLLRGLLIHAVWYHHVASNGWAQIVMLTQLCVTLAYDLDPDGIRDLGSDETRAPLGVYWLSNCVSRSFRKPIGMRRTRHIDDCMQKISTKSELSEDRLIKPYTLLQTFASRLMDHFEYAPTTGFSAKGNGFTHLVTESLVRELEQIKACIDVDAAEGRDPLELEVRYLRSWIREGALRDEYWDMPSDKRDVSINSTRTAMLWHLMGEQKAFIRFFLTFPVSEMPYLSFINFTRLCSIISSYATVAWALLRDIRGPAVTGLMQLTQSQIREGQRIIDEVNYTNIVADILQKLTALTSVPCAADWNTHTLVYVCAKLRAYSIYYSNETNRIIGLSDKVSMGAEPVDGLDNDSIITSLTVPHGYGAESDAGIAMPGDRDTVAVEISQQLSDEQFFDQSFWDSVMNDFSTSGLGLS